MIKKYEQNESKIASKQKNKSLKLLFLMERETRLELATSSLARRHSTTELPPQILRNIIIPNNKLMSSVYFFY